MKDLTKGNPFKLILLFALPVFLGCVFQQLYNMTDTFIVGHTVGADALTGVGSTGAITFLVLGFVNGVTTGFGVKISQRYGAGDYEGMRHAIGLSLVLGGGLTVVLTAVAVPCTGPLLRLMGTPTQYFGYAESYLLVIFSGIVSSMLYNLGANILRAVGDSKTPLFFLVAAACLNVGLDFAFILGCKLHYHGAALATVVSQLLSGIACFIYMFKRYRELRIGRASLKWDTRLAWGLLAVGLPMALQFSITAIGSIFQQTALNGLDAAYPGAVTAYVAASKIDAFATQTFVAIGAAMATYVGQNTGAGDYKRVKRGILAGMVYSVASAAIGFAFCYGLCFPLMRLFLKTETSQTLQLYFHDILGYGQKFLLIQSGCYLLLGIIYVFRNALQGMGKSGVAMFAGVTELAGRALTAFVFVRIWEYTGFCFSNAVAWLFADVFLITTFLLVNHNRKKGADGAPRGARKKRKEKPAGLTHAA